ncbi:biotin--[acetyl-CoA-carboxylase] ligase [bacterium]|nr:MAG: biotin--[acetyl-CoA-carboxylase] ligase [bacterium]
MYSKEELQQGLTTQVVGSKIFVFETIDSTNACARTLGDAGTQEGAVVVTNFQTSGRGRLGRTWLAEPDANLLFSVLLRPRISVDVSGQLTLYASVSIARAIEQCVGAPVECKWPNDLLLNGKKFCGILLENSSQQSELSYAVIGAGINVNQQSLSPEIASRATSLSIETGKTFDRKQVFHVVLQELDLLYKSAREGDFSFIEAEWTRRCLMFGKTVTVQQHDHTIAGTVLRLNHDAGLVIATSEGEQTVYAGDVTLVS